MNSGNTTAAHGRFSDTRAFAAMLEGFVEIAMFQLPLFPSLKVNLLCSKSHYFPSAISESQSESTLLAIAL
jgi:hypothetical protein